MPGGNENDDDDTNHNGGTENPGQSGAGSHEGSNIAGGSGSGEDDKNQNSDDNKDNLDHQSSTGSVGGGGIAGSIVGGVLLVGVVIAGVAFIVYRQRQKEQAYDKHHEEEDTSQGGQKAIAMIEMTQNPSVAAVGLVVDGPSEPRPNRPAAFRFNKALAAEPALQASRDRPSRRTEQKKQRPLHVPTSPMTPTAHGSLFSGSNDDAQGEQEMAVVATQFGAGKVLHCVRNGTCQVIELPWRLAGGAHAVLYRPVTA
jgi:hypothetical protein